MQHRDMHRYHGKHGSHTLDRLVPGDSATIAAVFGEGALRDRLLDMGLTPGTKVMMRKVAPMGDPIELMLRGYELTLRKSDAKNIEIVGGSDDHRIGGESEQRQDDTFQSVNGFKSACRKFSGRYRGQKGRHHPQP